MRRREFMTLLGSAAASWPIAARAQQAAMPVVGFFHLTSLETRRNYLADFHRGLREAGYVRRNVAVEYRWAQGQNDRLPGLVADLVRDKVSVIVILESTHGAKQFQLAPCKIWVSDGRAQSWLRFRRARRPEPGCADLALKTVKGRGTRLRNPKLSEVRRHPEWPSRKAQTVTLRNCSQ